jgi:aspartate/methionine/tyrosine aminotransferase
MIEINEHFLALQNNYLFSEIAKRVKAYKTEQPDKKLISLGIGDVSLPLPQAVCRPCMQRLMICRAKKVSEVTAPNRDMIF